MRRKTNAQHKQVGSFRKDKHGAGEVEAPADGMEAPAWLLDHAKEYWDKIEPMLRGMRINSSHYTPALGLLCNDMARYIELETLVTAEGFTTISGQGSVVTNPVWSARCKAREQVQKSIIEFGMTPVSVGRVTHKPSGSKPDGKAKYFEPRIAG